MTTKLRVRFDGTTLVPLGPVDLPMGSVMEADLHEVDVATGSPQSISEAIESLPKLDCATADEFDRAIASAREQQGGETSIAGTRPCK